MLIRKAIIPEDIELGDIMSSWDLDALFDTTAFIKQDCICHNVTGMFLLIYKRTEYPVDKHENSVINGNTIVSFILVDNHRTPYRWKCVYSDLKNPKH